MHILRYNMLRSVNWNPVESWQRDCLNIFDECLCSANKTSLQRVLLHHFTAYLLPSASFCSLSFCFSRITSASLINYYLNHFLSVEIDFSAKFTFAYGLRASFLCFRPSRKPIYSFPCQPASSHISNGPNHVGYHLQCDNERLRDSETSF